MNKRLICRCLTALTLLSLTTTAMSAPATATQGAKWVQFHDKQSGLALSYPPGWSAQAHGTEITVTSPDKNSVAMIRAFDHPPEQDARSRMSQFPNDVGGLFGQAVIQEITPVQTQSGEQIVGTFQYQTPGMGSGRGRMICLWAPNSAVYFVIGAPNSRAATDAKTLVNILQTIAVDKAPTGGESAPVSLQYTTWVDPRERAFSIEIPTGWNVQGGTFRGGPTDARTVIVATSPDRSITTIIGDQRIPALAVAPDQMSRMMRVREGQVYSPNGNYQVLSLRYLPAVEFNRYYIKNFVAQVADQIQIGAEHELPSSQPGPGMLHTGANTEFTAHNRNVDKTYHFVVHSEVTHTPSRVMDSSLISPIFVVGATDGNLESKMDTGTAVLGHIIQTMKVDPQWQANEIQKARGQNANLNPSPNSGGGGTRYDSSRIMGNYWRRNAARKEQQANFCDYIGDRQRVYNPTTGGVGRVQSGYSNNYQNGNGAVLQTNSAYSPGVDYTQLQKF